MKRISVKAFLILVQSGASLTRYKIESYNYFFAVILLFWKLSSESRKCHFLGPIIIIISNFIRGTCPQTPRWMPPTMHTKGSYQLLFKFCHLLRIVWTTLGLSVILHNFIYFLVSRHYLLTVNMILFPFFTAFMSQWFTTRDHVTLA